MGRATQPPRRMEKRDSLQKVLKAGKQADNLRTNKRVDGAGLRRARYANAAVLGRVGRACARERVRMPCGLYTR